MSMDFKELTYVLAIAKYKSITKAANSLYLSQPTLSKFLQNLEMSLNLKLFDRVEKKMILTYAGEYYVEKAREILELKNDLDLNLAEISSGRTGTLRIGFSSVRATEMILNVVPCFSQLHPNVQLKFHEVNARDFEALLVSGELDLAFYNLPIKSRSIEYQTLGYEEVVLVTSADHALTQKAVTRPDCQYPWVDISWAEHEKFIMLSDELRLSSIVRSLLGSMNLSPDVLFYSKNIDASCILASRGYGLTFASEHQISHIKFDKAPALFSIGNPNTKRTFVVAYRRGAFLPVFATDFIELMRSKQFE